MPKCLPLLVFVVISFNLVAQFPQKGFTDVTVGAGINHQFKVFEGMFGGGACVADFDRDGFEDVFITGGVNDDVLYHNNRNGTFTNIYEKTGLTLTKNYVTQGAAAADINRDGWVDLVVTTITLRNKKLPIPRAINLLFLNKGNGTFADATRAYGLSGLQSFSTGPSFGDFNADGYPDLYIGNYFNEFQGELSEINDATVVGATQISEGYLLMNEKGKRFRNVYHDYGLSQKGFGFGGVFTDFDNDGDQDLLVNHDFGYKRTPNLVLQNNYPDETFEDVAATVGLNLKINSMGTAVGDYNLDGLMDYFFTNIRFNRFMVNRGWGRNFEDQTRQKNLSYVTISWGANFADFDHDGDVDLFVCNGDLNPNCTPMGNYYFANSEGKTFEEKAAAVGLNDYGIGRGSVVFDMDNDGDLDLLAVNQAPVLAYPVPSVTKLYRNDMAQGNWLKIRLQGLQAESQGIGSRIVVVANGKRMLREVDGGGSSHLSQNSILMHVGLGAALHADSVIVHWSGGHTQVLTKVAANQLLTIKQTPYAKPYPRSIVAVLAAIVVAAGFLIWRIIMKKNKKIPNNK